MEKLVSRKLFMAIGGVVLVALNDKLKLGLSQDTIYYILGILGTYLIGQGIADAGNQGKKAEKIVDTSVTEGPEWNYVSTIDNEDSKELLEG